jgi:hypothetical protein
MDPGIAEHEAVALLRDDGNVPRALADIRRQGQDEARWEPVDYDPASLAKGGDIAAHVRDALRSQTEFEQDGYRYRIAPDLTVTILRSPQGGSPKVVEKRSKAWAAILEQAGDRVPILALRKTLAAQPDEVKVLFQPVAEALEKGDTARAADLAQDVTPDRLRAAYGKAMRDAANKPERIAALHDGLMALPEDVRAGVGGDPFTSLLDTYAKHGEAGGYAASNATRESLRRLGTSLMLADDSRRGERQARYGEARENSAYMGDLNAGIEGANAVRSARAQGTSDNDIRAGWAKAPDSPTKRAAIAELDRPTPIMQPKKVTHGEDTLSLAPVGTVKTPIVPEEPNDDWMNDADAFAAGQKKGKRGLLEPGNIDLHHRPIIHNPDGTYSTVNSYSVPFDEGTPDETWYNIPGVDDTRKLSEDEAIAQFKRTGKHLGRYADKDSAIGAAESLHEEQAAEYDQQAANDDDWTKDADTFATANKGKK